MSTLNNRATRSRVGRLKLYFPLSIRWYHLRSNPIANTCSWVSFFSIRTRLMLPAMRRSNFNTLSSALEVYFLRGTLQCFSTRSHFATGSSVRYRGPIRHGVQYMKSLSSAFWVLMCTLSLIGCAGFRSQSVYSKDGGSGQTGPSNLKVAKRELASDNSREMEERLKKSCSAGSKQGCELYQQAVKQRMDAEGAAYDEREKVRQQQIDSQIMELREEQLLRQIQHGDEQQKILQKMTDAMTKPKFVPKKSTHCKTRSRRELDGTVTLDTDCTD